MKRCLKKMAFSNKSISLFFRPFPGKRGTREFPLDRDLFLLPMQYISMWSFFSSTIDTHKAKYRYMIYDVKYPSGKYFCHDQDKSAFFGVVMGWICGGSVCRGMFLIMFCAPSSDTRRKMTYGCWAIARWKWVDSSRKEFAVTHHNSKQHSLQHVLNVNMSFFYSTLISHRNVRQISNNKACYLFFPGADPWY